MPQLALLKPYLRHIYFFALVGIYFSIFYPGLMSDDSHYIYRMAKTGHYNEGHPPLMAIVWGLLDKAVSGPSLMFCLNMALLWGAVYLLSFHLTQRGINSWLALHLPYLPWVGLYAGWIWKDIIFTFGYGFLSMILCCKAKNRQSFSFGGAVYFFLVLFYATAVKYQAQFIAPFLCYWFCTVQWPNSKNLSYFWKTAILSLSLVMSNSWINHMLIPQTERNHFWQYVKIYDLAGISVRCGKILLPDSLIRVPDLKAIEKKYALLWEPLIRSTDAPLKATSNDHERKELVKAWWNAVGTHPLCYLAHRTSLIFHGLLLPYQVSNFKRVLFSPLFYLPFQLWFMFSRRFIFPVRHLNKMGLGLIAVLFFFSLAGTPRYIYFSTYCFFLSVPLALSQRWFSQCKHNLLEKKYPIC
ncbi:MAG: hypothetical protein BGO07_01860 [Alphaproteobacteria bacterium 40-19]|nr:MAG: hypothetical protein BGO07_01860 [Alphaproteobacteria bacterium 40-19]